MPSWGSLLLAAVAFIPLLLTQRGQIGADTKSYLYLDPSRLLSRAPWMWDTNIGLGTVTHQNIGYLWPMGPYYWLMDTIGLPDWVAQRLWLGGIIFAAGMGVRFMLKEMRWVGAGVTVASFAYALSPYLLHYGARISVILLPFAGLPWLIGISSKSLRIGGWRWPAAFALVTLTVGGVNATSLLLVMLGPLLWFVHAVWITKEVSLGRAVATGLRISALTVITSLWWVAGLLLQGTYGIPILRYTETYYVVANAAVSTELVRGLGYWFFYGRDALGAWLTPAERMVQNIAALTLSFAIPGAAIASGILTRFRNRGYFALIVATGLVIGVGAHPWDDSAPMGALFGAWTRSDAGLAFRSTPRAIPLIILGFAVMLAAGVSALSNWRPGWHLPIAAVALLAICGNSWALFGGEMVDRNLKRDEQLPEYWLEAAEAMDSDYAFDTRVYETPGADFASYRFGNTVDPITPGLIDRPYVARELIPYGTPNSADLLNAIDIPAQQGSQDPASIVPVAQLLGIGTIAHRADLQFERFRTPRPRDLWNVLTGVEGLTVPEEFGTGLTGDASTNDASATLPLDDEVYFATPNNLPDAPAVSLFDVEDSRPILRTISADSPTVMAADGEGIVNWASTGALNPDRAIFYSAAFAADTAGLEELISTPGAQLVVTDTNRRSARRWGSVRDNDGYTERVGEVALDPDPGDNRLEKFPDAGDDSFTVSEQIGDATLSASSYGNPVSYTPADRAAFAMDGDPSTAWRVGAFEEVRGEFLEVDLDHEVVASEITLAQSLQRGNRWITEVELTFDGEDPLLVPLDESSFDPNGVGQIIEFPSRSFKKLRITITEANLGVADRYVGISDVGISEVGIPGIAPITEVVRPPTDLLEVAGSDAIDRELSYVFTRRRSDPAEVVVRDEEPQMQRLVQGGGGRTYEVFGKATASTAISDATLATWLGLPTPAEGGLSVTSTSHSIVDLRARALFAMDGDSSTAWQTGLNSPVGGPDAPTIDIVSATPITFDELNLQFVNDGRHSVPTRLAIRVDGGEPVTVDVPALAATERGERGAVEERTISTPPLTGREIAISVDGIDESGSLDWFSSFPTVLPVAISELGIGTTVSIPPDDTPFDLPCQPDLLTIDGTAVPISSSGTVGEILDNSLMPIQACEEVALDSDDVLLTTGLGSDSLKIDQIVLASAAGGGVGVNTEVAGPKPIAPGPSTETATEARLEWSVDVADATEPYWLVMGQSFSSGFTAVTSDGVDLGESELINGYANGWLVDPAVVGPDASITIKWAPQSIIWLALIASAFGVLICLAALLLPIRILAGKRLDEPQPILAVGISPLLAEGKVLSPASVAAWAMGTGVLAWLLTGWKVGIVAAVLIAAGLGLRRGQLLMRAVTVGAFGAAAAFIILKQIRAGYIVDFNWMNQFEITHAWTLLAIALLLADPLVSHLRRNQA